MATLAFGDAPKAATAGLPELKLELRAADTMRSGERAGEAIPERYRLRYASGQRGITLKAAPRDTKALAHELQHIRKELDELIAQLSAMNGKAKA